MVQSILPRILDAVQTRFEEARSILSFPEYVELLLESPTTHCRSSAQYIGDALSFFGTSEVETPLGKLTRYKLFDGDENDNASHVVGQEFAQQQIQRLVNNFVREGRATRLVLLHGPNGSGKSSLVQSLIDGLEHYSHQPEGVLYRFNWIFPAEKLRKSGIGFGKSESAPVDLNSYAHLEGDQVEARINSPLRDHPLLLIPLTERHQLFEDLFKDEKLPKNFPLSQYLKNGQLSPRNQTIYEALLAHYKGDYGEVLRHVQVERYYISQRYRSSAVTIEPQMHVDATLRQVTADRSMSSLPKPLNTLSLFEPLGALVDANRGVLEFSDLLKRPPEAFKYLLGTCETGRAIVDPMILFLDLVLIGTANELNLDQFKKYPEFMSFKSRIELVRVPYLLRYSVEQTIYDDLLSKSQTVKPITPHTTKLAALWAVLTRLELPEEERFPEEVGLLAASLKPIEKAKLYDKGSVPPRFSTEEAKVLRQNLHILFNESINEDLYEGRMGASPREIRTVLLNAGQNQDYPCLSPLALFEELERLAQARSVYQFLQREPKNGYYDADQFVDLVREEHLNIIDREFRKATGLIQPEQYAQLLERYIQHVKAYLRKEKVQNQVTRASEDPDKKLMESVEEILLSKGDEPEQFRNDLIGKIAVHSIENPNETVDFAWLFSEYINKMERDAFAKQFKRLRRLAEHCLMLLVEDKPKLKAADEAEAKKTIDAFINDFGYSREGAREQFALLLRNRYSESELPEKESE